MATNFYFNNFQSSQEQLLIENLVIESIKIYGLDVFYLRRTKRDYDSLYGEAPVSEFNSKYMVEMYVKNVDGFKGDGDFLSKFNLEIRDQITFCIARRTFAEEVGSYEGDMVRPLEGDLIFFPLNNKCFEIKFVEHEAIFYQLGSLQLWELTCELFEYSGEKFNTGIEEIDKVYIDHTLDAFDYGLYMEDGSRLVEEVTGYDLVNEQYVVTNADPMADNIIIQRETDDFIDFSEKDPFSESGVY